MPGQKVLAVFPNLETGALFGRAALAVPDLSLITVNDWEEAQAVLDQELPDLIVVSEGMPLLTGGSPALEWLQKYPQAPVVLVVKITASERQMLSALRQGYFDCLQAPFSVDQLQALMERVQAQRRRWEPQLQQLAGRGQASLEKRLNALEAIQRVGRQVTALLDLDSILLAVVEAAVDLTGAEEGSLLLLDETSGELYVRASKNFQEEFARTFRLPIRNTLVSQVLRTAKPLLIDQDTPQKIKTAYLVHTLLYMPLLVQGRVIGVLEVDHRQTRKAFSDDHVMLVGALADYAAIAIENARLYARSEAERHKLDSILRGIEEAVIIIDQDQRLVLMNRHACQAFEVSDPNVAGKRLSAVISHPELLETVRDAAGKSPSRVELGLKDGRVLHAQLTPLPEIGLVISMQDITHLKELDRIKSDFVNTVSHDLRSPLTAILGYIELFDRVGPVNDTQREFIRRVQVSVHNITALINDLLDLGRIEAGFDVRKELVPFAAIVRFVVDGLQPRSQEKSQQMVVDLPDDLPQVLGNPIRLRQMLNNLVNNAIKYTPDRGQVTVYARRQGEQIVLQISDNGPGIPVADQPYIFDKFYRASNAPQETPGTGLGLAIVKSIVENHLGRIWVESQPGQGATFTVLLPTVEKEL
ncbi:MAG: ATP-binding protein [Chloroflexota bacterium]